MAGGQLVPHQLPDGRTVMVPDYLLPNQSGLGLPPRPPPGPLYAGPGVPDLPPETGIPAQFGARQPGHVEPPASAYIEPTAAQEAPAAKAERERLQSENYVSAEEAAKRRASNAYAKEQDKKRSAAAGPGNVDPSTLATGGPRRTQTQGQNEPDQNGGMDPLVRQVFNEGPRGGVVRRPGLEVGSVKVEREPGRELLPEQLQALGLQPVPDLGEEIDPDAPPQYRDRKTLIMPEPAMRKVLSPVNRGAENAGKSAQLQFEQQEQLRHDYGIVQRAALVDESNAIDDNLAAIADRRKRIADLHDVADRRMAEAESQEPRTRGEIWESKGNLARGTAILAAFLSGAAAGLHGRGGSPAWDMIEKSIDDAVGEERYKAERRMKLGLEAKNDWERAVTLYGDQDIANLEAKQRKSANMLATAQQMLSDRQLDATAKMRGEQIVAAGKAAYMARQQQLYEMLTGHAIKEEVNYKQGAPTGGGAGLDTLGRLERAARAKKAVDTISSTGTNPERPVVEGTTEAIGGALDTVLAARGVKTRLQALKISEDDLDDPRSGAYDYVSKNIPGTETRRIGQDLDQDTEQLARGAQLFLGKSDNDAALAERAAKGLGGSGRERFQSASRLERKAINRIKLSVSGMTPDQRNAWFRALPPDQAEVVKGILDVNTAPAKVSPTFKGE